MAIQVRKQTSTVWVWMGRNGTGRDTAVQCSAVQCSAVQYSPVQFAVEPAEEGICHSP